MSIYSHRFVALGVLGLVIGVAGQARAGGGLLGDSIDAQYFVPTISTLVEDFGTQTLDPTASWLVFYNNLSLTVTNSTILIAAPPGGAIGFGGPAEFAGVGFTDVTSDPHITGVTIDPSSTVPGIDASRISFTSNQVFANFEGRGFGSGQQLLLDLRFGSVPEPSSLTLAGIAGLAGVGMLMWRRSHAWNGVAEVRVNRF
jgi:hypothetical protein